VKKPSVFFLSIMILAGRPATGQDLRFSGSIKNFTSMFVLAEPDKPSETTSRPLRLGLSNTRLRLCLDFAPNERLSFGIAYDLSPRVQDPFFFNSSPFPVSQSPAGYRVADFRPLLAPEKNSPGDRFGLYHNLDRLSVNLKMDFGDLTIGRQPVAWGSGRVTNPTDVIAPFSFHELDKEDRIGVDAVRLRVPLSSLSELDMGYVFGRNFRIDRSAFFLRTKVHVWKTDLAVLLLGFRDDVLLGFDLARSVGRASVWLESAYVFPGALNHDLPTAKNYVRITAGIQQSLSPGLQGFMEYHFNSAGAARSADYAGLSIQPAYARGAAYLLGRHYLSAGMTCQTFPLIPFTGLVIWNVGDGSLSLSPQAEYNVAENVYLAAGAYLGIGRHPGARPSAGPGGLAELRSEFGGYPDLAFLSFRFYF
jgi:hypothetical protein